MGLHRGRACWGIGLSLPPGCKRERVPAKGKDYLMRRITPFILLASIFVLICLATPTLVDHVKAAPALASPTALGEPLLVNGVDMSISGDLSEALPLKVQAALDGPSRLEASYVSTVIKLVNAQRAKAGLRKLSSNSKLALAARRHTTDMATHNFFSHTGSNGSSMTDRLTKAGYKYSAAGETLYAGGGQLKTPQQCVTAWLNSPGHRSIMLSSAYTQIGVGYKYSAKSTYGGYYTADFGKPR